jgi:hypothetical protein
VSSALNGRFQAGGLDEGTITVQVAAWGENNYIRTEPVTVTPGDLAVRLVVRKGESISGHVYNADGTPANQIQIEALDADGIQVSQAWVWQGEGAFHVRGLPKGTYTLRVTRWVEGKQKILATADGIATGTIDVELRATD